MDFAKLPADAPRIYGWEAKFDHSSRQYQAVNAIIATDLSPEMRYSITSAALEAVYALQVRDYARVDMRLSRDGKPYVIEVNANPYLEQTSAFAFAALQAGMGYNTLIKSLVEIAWTCSKDRASAKGLACPINRSESGQPL
jgi:D-alanine-D-alanine ligase